MAPLHELLLTYWIKRVTSMWPFVLVALYFYWYTFISHAICDSYTKLWCEWKGNGPKISYNEIYFGNKFQQTFPKIFLIIFHMIVSLSVCLLACSNLKRPQIASIIPSTLNRHIKVLMRIRQLIQMCSVLMVVYNIQKHSSSESSSLHEDHQIVWAWRWK